MVKHYNALIDLLSYIAMAVVLGIIVTICIDVISRYTFNRPLGWVFEFVQHGLLIMLFCGMPSVARQRAHLTIDLVYELAPQRLAFGFSIASFALAALVSGWLGTYAAVVTIDNYMRGVVTAGIYPIPRAYLLSVVALGFVLTAIEFARLAISAARLGAIPKGIVPDDEGPVTPTI